MLNPINNKQIISPIVKNNNPMKSLSTSQDYQWGEIKSEKEEKNK